MVKTVDKKKKWDKILKQGFALKKGPVVGVGYPENKVDNAVIQYATYNHFGTFVNGEMRIPPRPFLAVTIDVNKEKIFNLKKKLGERILAGQLSVQKALGTIGAVVTGMVKETIDGPYFAENVPNALSTMQKKGSSTPLIDTGIMKGATTWEVYPNGKPE